MDRVVTQSDKLVLNDDPADCRPERWLESEAQSWIMDKAMLIFGAGTRTWIDGYVRYFWLMSLSFIANLI
jgi:hypothetical protein